jgi:hypothetical protein
VFYGQLLFLYQLELRTAASSRAGNGYIGKGEGFGRPWAMEKCSGL